MTQMDRRYSSTRIGAPGAIPGVPMGQPLDGPRRIQRLRTKGWRMPEGAVYVGRPTRWGNWARMNPKSDISRRVAVAHFRRGIEAWEGENFGAFRESCLDPLRGKDLACWCPLDKPCHADVLLELANA